MYAEPARSSILSRSGPAIAVIGLHLLIIYGLVISMGIVEMPKFAAPVEAIFIPEQTQSQPEPDIQVEPEIETAVPLDQPIPEMQIEEAVAPPAETPVPASENAITGAAMTGAPAQDLKAASRVEPVYPPAARRAGEEGTVRLKVLVNERGRPSTVEVAQSSGFERLDKAAVNAVRKWRFEAATDGSKAIQAWTQVAITFRLTES